MSVKSHLTYGASVRPENAVTYSAGNEGQNICGVFSETAPLQRSSTPSVVRPCVQSAIFPAESTHAHYSIYGVRFLALRVRYLRRLSLSISRPGLAIEIQRRGFSTLVLFIYILVSLQFTVHACVYSILYACRYMYMSVYTCIYVCAHKLWI